MASNFLSKQVTAIIRHEDMNDLRNRLKSYAARRQFSFSKIYYAKAKGYDVTCASFTKESDFSMMSKNKRPGKEQLVEIPHSKNSRLFEVLEDSEKVVAASESEVESESESNPVPTEQKDEKQTCASPTKSKLDHLLEIPSHESPEKKTSQEIWLNSYIRKYRTIDNRFESGSATTHLVARFVQKGIKKPVPANRYVEMEYKFNRFTNGEEFETKGCLESLLPIPGEDSLESLFDERVYQPDVDLFFQNFDYFINNLEGIVWWNGFNISASGPRENRLQIQDFDMEPGRIVISLEKVKDLHIIRDPFRLELRAEDLTGKLKWFRIKGDWISTLKMSGPKDGIFTIDFPDYPKIYTKEEN